MDDKRHEQIARRLLAKSNDGSIQWQATESEGVYQASFSDFSVRARRSQTTDVFGADFVHHVLEIYDEEGTLVDEIAEQTLETVLGQVYSFARRQALHVDEMLDTILKQLT